MQRAQRGVASTKESCSCSNELGNCGTRPRMSNSYASIRVMLGPSQFDHDKLEGFVVLQRIEPGKAMLVRVVAMLTKLLERFDPEQFRVRESPSNPVLPFEHEHDDEHEHD